MPDRGPVPRAEAGPEAGLAELLGRATERVPLDGAPGKSGAEMERLVIDGQPYVLKRLDLAESQHRRFLRHMAELHAAFWDCGRDCDVVPAMHRYLELSLWLAKAEQTIGSEHLVPSLVARGWPLLAEVAPAAAAVVTPLACDPGPLVAALDATPHTFVHSNWKRARLDQPGQGGRRDGAASLWLRAPAWYLRFKQETERATGDPEVLAAQLAAAGFGQVRIRPVTVRTGVSAPAELAAWRLGMAHVAPFISSLQARDATAARQAAEQAVAAAAAGPLTVSLLVTTAN